MKRTLTISDREALQGEPQGYFVVVPADSGGDGDISFVELFWRLWRGKLWIVIFMAAFAAVAGVRAYRAPLIYRPEASLAVTAEQHGSALGAIAGQLGGLASLAGIGLGEDGSKRKTAIAVLKSRELAAEFVKSHDLMHVFFKGLWDEHTKTYRGTLFHRPPTFNDAVETFMSLRKIKEETKSGLITLAFEWIDPTVATTWVNEYTAMANERLRQKAIYSAQQSLTYLRNELSRTGQEPIRQSLYRLMESRLNEAMLASVEPEFAFQVIDRAVVPDWHRFVRPNRMLQIVLGTLLGGVCGSVFVLWRTRRTAQSR